jgi:hypothetical protein
VKRSPCPAANTLAQKAWDHGWSLLVMRRTHIDLPETGQSVKDQHGNSRLIVRTHKLDAVRLTARHPDGRAFVALWTSTGDSPSGKPSWSYELGHRAGEWAPGFVTATELETYVTGVVKIRKPCKTKTEEVAA